jgi:hypothetical protein
MKLKLKLKLLSAGMPTEKPADLNTEEVAENCRRARGGRSFAGSSAIFAPRGRIEDPTPHYFL